MVALPYRVADAVLVIGADFAHRDALERAVLAREFRAVQVYVILAETGQDTIAVGGTVDLRDVVVRVQLRGRRLPRELGLSALLAGTEDLGRLIACYQADVRRARFPELGPRCAKRLKDAWTRPDWRGRERVGRRSGARDAGRRCR